MTQRFYSGSPNGGPVSPSHSQAHPQAHATTAPQAAPQYEWQQAPEPAPDLQPAQMAAPAAAATAPWLQSQPRVDYVPQSAPHSAPQYAPQAAPKPAPQSTPKYAQQAAPRQQRNLHAVAAGGAAAAHHAQSHNLFNTQPNPIQPAPAQGAALPKLGTTQWLGAGLSFALLLGLGIWGYQVMMRDANGVPVIRALAGDARVVPDDPGGQLAMHQGLAVNSVTADGSAAAPADQLVLAPKPIALTDEDQPLGENAEILTAYAPQSDAYAVTPLEEQSTALSGLNSEAQVIDLADDLEKIAVENDPLELASIATEEAEPRAGIPIPVDPNVISSPVPKKRPVRLAAAATAAPSAPGAASTDLNDVAGALLAAVGSQGEIKVSDVPTGARLVQFSAFRSQDIARQEWDRLSGKFGELLDGKMRVIEEAQSGGKTFYRLRAYGFGGSEDADRFCAAVTAMNEQCVPTVQR